MALSRWQNRIESWQSSGLSQAAYCRQHGLNPNTFSSGLHHFRSRGKAQNLELIPVQVQPVPTASEVMVLRHAEGHQLELPVTVSPRWLAELLQCLG
jgi:hypothetical protein